MRRFKKLLAAGALFLFLFTASATHAEISQPITLLSGVTVDTPSSVFATGNYQWCLIRATSAAGSTAEVVIYGSDSAGGSFDPFASIVNPAAVATINNPQYYIGSCPAFLKVATVSQSGGAVTVTLATAGKR